MSIERHEPEMDDLILPGSTLEKIAEDVGNESGPAEGPLWWREDDQLIFSSIGNDRRMKWSKPKGLSVLQERVNYCNGLTRDRQGRLVVCEVRTRRVIRIEHDGSRTVIANNYRGQSLNVPNDVVVKSDGAIYFTDPMSGTAKSKLDFCGVYRVSPDLGDINVLVWDFVSPNGLAFSPDEKILYIDDTRRQHIRAFEVGPNGLLLRATDRIFATLIGDLPGLPDGMKVDSRGNVYCTGPGGVWIFDPSGKHLGTILTNSRQTTNLAWGDKDWKTLFITTWNELFSIRMNVPGIPVPRGVL